MSNGDEWDSYSFAGQLKKEKLPSTGNGQFMLLGLISVWLCLILIALILKKY
ncbi:LPXTG cell wall anchor domain-containing protein [endosymbiont 'TC1' of Trimyema compressum]|uniref:LPXTG cell wall anchor domain-containing protein n=1 Tax=endosymbiont 'TC1' of Trimyema compressum TaxID=243899 RepID=UPI00139229AB|nr:LPXTG cell wall anchor domain-containing protein [endosymbiont 'TC1' of Trimyema compressum]